MGTKKKSIGLLWAQFSAYHVDRIQAAARRLSGRVDVHAIQVSTKSNVYAWDPHESVHGAQLHTLFPGRTYEGISKLSRLWAQYKACRGCDMVFIGIAYSEPEIIPLAWMLRLGGTRVVMMTATKYDDFPRSVWFELFKGLGLSVYQAGVVGGRRQAEYLRFLGLSKRKLLPGYDSVSMERVREEALAGSGDKEVRFEDRPFIYVGRFVEKKNLLTLIDAYAVYVKKAGADARRLMLVGAGNQEPLMCARMAEHGVTHLIDMPGFVPADKVSALLHGGLALLLVSVEEQWGLVVNEALAVSLPIISSSVVGSNDVLTRNLVNGYIVETTSVDGIAQAMFKMAESRERWEAMSAASKERAWAADSERYADAVELLVYPGIEPAASDMHRFMGELGMARTDL